MPAKDRSNDGPRFTIGDPSEDSAVFIYDDDFGFDALLKITGDWSPENKRRYAEAVCKALNGADIPVPPDHTTAAKAAAAEANAAMAAFQRDEEPDSALLDAIGDQENYREGRRG